MSFRDRFRNITRTGPVQVGTHQNKRGKGQHVAACTAPGCGWSADYPDRAAADLAAQTHRCQPNP